MIINALKIISSKMQNYLLLSLNYLLKSDFFFRQLYDSLVRESMLIIFMMSCKLDDGVLSKTTMLVERLPLPNG